MSTSSLDLYVTPSTLEVDYDKNLTELYRAITDQDWDTAVRVCEQSPVQAATWVVRHYEDDDDDDGEQEIMWRFLPIHSACARQPPAKVISALLRAYPDGAGCIDDQGMYALHYACGNQASRDVIRQLLVHFPEAAKIADPRGMLPLHYLACWGPSSVAVVDMLLVANRNVADIKDADGNTPFDLALEGEYPERDAVVAVLEKWLKPSELLEAKSNRSTSSRKSTASSVKTASSRKSASDSTKMSLAPSVKTSSSRKSTTTTTNRKGPVSRSTMPATPTTKTSSGRSTISPVEEEKKEDMDNRDETIQLKTEILSLKREMASKEDEHAKILSDTVRAKEEAFAKSFRELEDNWRSKCDVLESKLKRQDDELRSAKADLEDIHNALDKKSDELKRTKRDAEDTRKQLEKSNSELRGLRLTLGDLMEKHEAFQKKAGNVSDRLGSLSVSLDSMLMRQNILTASIKERAEKHKHLFETRQQRLKELLEIEETIREDEDQLETTVKKQSREMEAIAAVIAAARD